MRTKFESLQLFSPNMNMFKTCKMRQTVCVCVCEAPQQSEASQDFLNSCSSDQVSCTAETSSHTEEDGETAGLAVGITVVCCHSYSSDCVCVSGETDSERACDTLLMCIVTVLNHGLRNGGGVGDVLRKPSKNVNTTFYPSHHTD